MPARVDHDLRRAQIVEALLVIAARDGLHTVTMRGVADTAGVSLRLVQYYFGTKADLMHAALLHLEKQSNQRWAHRLAALPEQAGARRILETYFDEALPTDERSRAFHVVFTAYTALAMTDRALARRPFVDGPLRIQATLIDILTSARDSGEIRDCLDPDRESQRLMAVEHGLGAAILIGQLTVGAALDIAAYHLDRLFDPSGA